ncbi:MAG: hypothetical protein GF364_04895 [Candidatus Lokiarchaeota archaeon]|nr:hypothetical protein [Candidatus Lokiarchaeota archaeon]
MTNPIIKSKAINLISKIDQKRYPNIFGKMASSRISDDIINLVSDMIKSGKIKSSELEENVTISKNKFMEMYGDTVVKASRVNFPDLYSRNHYIFITYNVLTNDDKDIYVIDKNHTMSGIDIFFNQKLKINALGTSITSGWVKDDNKVYAYFKDYDY